MWLCVGGMDIHVHVDTQPRTHTSVGMSEYKTWRGGYDTGLGSWFPKRTLLGRRDYRVKHTSGDGRWKQGEQHRVRSGEGGRGRCSLTRPWLPASRCLSGDPDSLGPARVPAPQGSFLRSWAVMLFQRCQRSKEGKRHWLFFSNS